jgi:hypothetical protein
MKLGSEELDCRPYGQGQSAVIRAEAARQAAVEGYRNGINETARTEELLRTRVI